MKSIKNSAKIVEFGNKSRTTQNGKNDSTEMGECGHLKISHNIKLSNRPPLVLIIIMMQFTIESTKDGSQCYPTFSQCCILTCAFLYYLRYPEANH